MVAIAAPKLYTFPKYNTTEIVEFMTADVIGQGAFVYFGNKNKMKGRPVRNRKTIQQIVNKREYTYMTYSGFNLPWCGKTVKNLQWVAAITVDMDEHMPLDELLDTINCTGLGLPTLVVATDKGYHITWKLEKAVRAYPGAQKFIRAITEAVIRELRAQGLNIDTAYRTPERYTRVPYNAVWFVKKAYPLQFFVDWAEINNIQLRSNPFWVVGRLAVAGDVLNNPAVQKLMDGVYKNIRNLSAYALALCHKTAGYSKDEVLSILLEWNERNTVPLPEKELWYVVESAYRYGKLPSPRIIRELTGVDPGFRIVPVRRRRSDTAGVITAVLNQHGGVLETTYDEFAALCGISRRTLFRHLRELETAGVITRRTARRGRNGTLTVFALTANYSSKAIICQTPGEQLCGMPETVQTENTATVPEPTVKPVAAKPTTPGTGNRPAQTCLYQFTGRPAGRYPDRTRHHSGLPPPGIRYQKKSSHFSKS